MLKEEFYPNTDLISMVDEAEDCEIPSIDISIQEAPLVIKQSNDLDSTITEIGRTLNVNEEDIEECES